MTIMMNYNYSFWFWLKWEERSIFAKYAIFDVFFEWVAIIQIFPFDVDEVVEHMVNIMF
jgi:hypothetical protein